MIWIKLLSCSTGNKSSLTTNGFVRVAAVSNRPAKLLWGIFYYHNPHQRNAIALRLGRTSMRPYGIVVLLSPSTECDREDSATTNLR
ncbi:MAG: hypothetical protein RID53_27675 [Coleofasciculus sp. B1-GNL1-01]|uniref:hypothetical protein n=1 Tax=Coleofasciculus sp. B1-GNL1-01 TaxID=3068484 RepID=UPI0032F499BD